MKRYLWNCFKARTEQEALKAEDENKHVILIESLPEECFIYILTNSVADRTRVERVNRKVAKSWY